ncbi:MAG: FadR family transcriptional regulator [Alphaproteobacteria bacterium]|nr:MAG: FadR family transcriptional regulator [Alphaproteobacteria bacterium]
MLTNPGATDREFAIARLTEFIAEGGYAPGDRLPPERDLMVELGMTRTMLRKALETLEGQGRIWRHVGKGTFIAANAGPSRPRRLSELSQQVSPVNMMRARLCLEPAVAREAAINASDSAVRRIHAARDRAVEAPSWDEYEAQDDAFHRAIAEATGNMLLLELFDQLNQVRRAVAWNSVIRHSDRPPRDHPSFAEHDRIAQAIEARDPAEAHAAMRNHLGSVSARLFGEI